jgi:hypothetical protein
MTEAEWLACCDPTPMLADVRAWASERQLRLFAGACCHRIKVALKDRSDRVMQAAQKLWISHGVRRSDPRYRETWKVEKVWEYVDGGWEYADGAARREHLEAVESAVRFLHQRLTDKSFDKPWEHAAVSAVLAAAAKPIDADAAARQAADAIRPEARAAERATQAALMRDIFGNPFRAMPANRPWLTSEVVRLAADIYDQCAFERMSELAGALAAAGCTEPDMLEHCRGPGPHVRGCWVLDLIRRPVTTQSEWLACCDPTPMLAAVRDRASERQLRLFACACCRRVSGVLRDLELTEALELVEWHVEGVATRRELEQAAWSAEWRRDRIRDGERPEGKPAPPRVRAREGSAAALACAATDPVDADGAARCAADAVAEEVRSTVRAAQAALLLDIFGNPFRPAPAGDRTGLTTDVITLAAKIYCDRTFEQMPQLADLLREAGCHDAEILDHCRGPGPHARGCWVLDLIQTEVR